MGVRDQPEAVEKLERPIDRRDVDTLGGPLDAGRDLFRGRVIERGDRLEDELALRCDPVTAGPQFLVPGPSLSLAMLHDVECSSGGGSGPPAKNLLRTSGSLT